MPSALRPGCLPPLLAYSMRKDGNCCRARRSHKCAGLTGHGRLWRWPSAVREQRNQQRRAGQDWQLDVACQAVNGGSVPAKPQKAAGRRAKPTPGNCCRVFNPFMCCSCAHPLRLSSILSLMLMMTLCCCRRKSCFRTCSAFWRCVRASSKWASCDACQDRSVRFLDLTPCLPACPDCWLTTHSWQPRARAPCA